MAKKGRDKRNKADSLSTHILAVFSADPFRSYNYKQVAAAMGIKDKATRDLIFSTMLEMLKEGILQEVKRGKFRLDLSRFDQIVPASRYIIGTVDMKQTGKAYIVPREPGEDIYISPSHTGKAFHGDTVKVFLFPRRPGRKLEGQVVEVLKRAKTHFVGKLQLSDKYAFVIPDNPSMAVDFFIPREYLNKAKDGEKVVVELMEWPEYARNPFGRIIKVLGKPGEHQVEMQSILVEWDFPIGFSREAEKEAKAIPKAIPPEEIEKRRDFRKVFTITIDPADAKDFDDALSFRQLEGGLYEVGIHIADVAHYVRPGTAIDQEAERRGTSVYLVDRVIPMLPEKLSNFVCSLRPNEDKLCFSAVFVMDREAHITSQWFGKSIIRSDYRFNYDEVQQIIEGGQHAVRDEIIALYKLSAKLRAERMKKGTINFETKEVKFDLDDKGKPLGVYIKEQKEANWLIEDFMLLANRRVAEWVGHTKGKTRSKTFVYRVHDEPPAEKINQFAQFVSKLGYSIKLGSRASFARSLNRLFTEVAGKGEENLIETIAVRTMAKAYYSTDNIGHYGLAFDFYTHFTSPIRRYPDMMVHRLFWDYLNGAGSADKEFYEERCIHASEMERKALEAERSSVKLKQAEFMKDKVGQIFDALISGVSKYGIFAEIVDNYCEGMIRLRDLTDDFYYLDEDNYQVIGQRYGETYRLGDPVKVIVKNVDIQKKQIDFKLVKS
ncbi:MAG TPA: ribonuclease R [Bacteroidales bacterium]|jgi:ribonuclease R|nr:MAG: Ribonuclease R [Bacteroidetes bacterium ADurb.Bin012]HNQ60485.1 ribonuclease R [Bacteroidales bacterium]HNU22242.1 ribonuclease R [Bacteroidales bacterium]HNV17711.1 ribonuclease R [Bacteroidales bacterium]HNZ79880.1 ribonuclease R [Bacteroidales bacterium]